MDSACSCIASSLCNLPLILKDQHEVEVCVNPVTNLIIIIFIYRACADLRNIVFIFRQSFIGYIEPNIVE